MSKPFGPACRAVILSASVLAAGVLAAGPALAQAPAPDSPAPATAPATPAPATPTPATPTPATSGVVATTNNPNLAVATLKLQTGQRLSKVIGSDVYNEGGDKIGVVDDLIMTPDDKVVMAIVSVGGFIGIGSKLVAVPWGQMRQDGAKVVLAGANKDTLNAMPGFEY